MANTRHMTSSRIGRLSMIGKLASGIVGGMVSEGARQIAQGKRPSIDELLLTPANARRLTNRLSEMRGAAMKVGQLLSMDSGQILPTEVSDILAYLRESAHQMPRSQLVGVLQQAWGDDWQRHFKQFDFNPIAAASIGQVHRATLPDNQQLAVKIQYPGIRRSIDSDVDNVASLLQLFNLIPKQMKLQSVLAEAKKQLHIEADYMKEADALTRFSDHIGSDRRFSVPQVLTPLTTADVLTMTYLDGQAIESLTDQPLNVRNAAASALLELSLREVFDWGFVQTDPNFANYRYQANSSQIQLLDFGATRVVSTEQRIAVRTLLHACRQGHRSDIENAAAQVGYLDETDPPIYRSGIVSLLLDVSEPVRTNGRFNFGRSDLADRMRDRLIQMRLQEKYWRLPPADVLFLHRKLGGLYLLLKRLRARIDVADVLYRLNSV
ncbi:MAG: AarF/ABC1/UbiB kinase family protein [Gammaproteobacteria bacterium]|nr:AarF/ABC1/UbiB kinase family protein [Gammaproteobacteria bacterium]